MSRLKIATANVAGQTVESLYKDLERMIIASPPGICPVDLHSIFSDCAMRRPAANAFRVV